MRIPVTVQISLSPGDWRLAEHMLPHQVRSVRGQVAEILLTIDLERSTGRFGDDWEMGRDRILQTARSIDGARVERVDYAPAISREIARCYFGRGRIPAKDWRGGPFYSYFFALHAARNDLVFHLDADMFLGGDATPWFDRAVELIKNNERFIMVSPLPGPPAENGRLVSQSAPFDKSLGGFVFDSMSTRIFLLDRARLADELGPLGLPWPAPGQAARAVLRRQALAELPEAILSRHMRRSGKRRLDFAGPGSGFWSLHPPYRCESFYRSLPALIDRVERGDIPPEQRGCHDLNDSMVDWSEARARLHTGARHRRLLAMLRIPHGGD